MEQGRAELEQDIDICYDKKFKTYDEFLDLLEERKHQLGERWVKTSGGHTVEAANRVLKNCEKFFKAEFKYKYVNFSCIHGGIHRSRATKRNSSTYKLKCPVYVQLSANRKEDALVVKKVMLVHNHELVPPSTRLYALDRRPTDGEAIEITKLRKLGISASKIIAHMAQSSGKVFKRHDIYNISRGSKKKQLPRSNLTDTYSRQTELKLGTATIQEQKTTQSVKLTELQKRTRGSVLMDKLLTVMVTGGMDSYMTRCRVLEKIINEWRLGHDIPDFSELTNFPEQMDSFCPDDNVGNVVLADNAVNINDHIVLHGKDEDVVSPVYQNVDNNGMFSGAKGEDARLGCVGDKNIIVYGLSKLKEIGNTQGNVVNPKQNEVNKIVPGAGTVLVCTNVSLQDVVQFIAFDHAYYIDPGHLGELRLK